MEEAHKLRDIAAQEDAAKAEERRLQAEKVAGLALPFQNGSRILSFLLFDFCQVFGESSPVAQ